MTAKARLPSGAMATAATSLPIGTSATAFTAVPSINSTETLLPARLAISARSPLREMARPEGCLPTVTVSISLGGAASRSMTYSLSSGAGFQAPLSCTELTELATRPRRPFGVICRLVGGPSREFTSGKLARMRGWAGLAMSMTSTASAPGWRIFGRRRRRRPWSRARSGCRWRSRAPGARRRGQRRRLPWPAKSAWMSKLPPPGLRPVYRAHECGNRSSPRPDRNCGDSYGQRVGGLFSLPLNACRLSAGDNGIALSQTPLPTTKPIRYHRKRRHALAARQSAHHEKHRRGVTPCP